MIKSNRLNTVIKRIFNEHRCPERPNKFLDSHDDGIERNPETLTWNTEDRDPTQLSCKR